MRNSIEFTNVSKIYSKGFRGIKISAVTDLSFSVPENGISGFVGPNGAGKTTCIKMALGLVRPSSGIINIRGIDASLDKSRRRIGYVSEIPYFYGHLTAMESLAFTYRLQGYDRAKVRMESERVICAVGLDPSALAKKKLRELSKGMQQRLNLAHAIIGEPELLILDEPMSGLDPIGRRLFRDVFRSISASGIPLFFSTHVIEDIETVCDNLVVLSKGRLSYCGGIRDIVARGNLGTDVVVENCDDDLSSSLKEKGCTVTDLHPSGVNIFLPSAIGSRDVISALISAGKIPLSITPVRQALETVLYNQGNNKEGS